MPTQVVDKGFLHTTESHMPAVESKFLGAMKGCVRRDRTNTFRNKNGNIYMCDLRKKKNKIHLKIFHLSNILLTLKRLGNVSF